MKNTCEIFTKSGERAIDVKSIKSLTECVMQLPQTKLSYINQKGEYTPKRKKLHAEIIKEFKDGVTCIDKGKPIAVLMGGSPASGKSTFLKSYRPYLLSNNLFKVDADEIRAKLPEYKGWNATQTHEETGDIVKTLISDRNIGVPCKFDFIYDGTMTNVKKYLTLIDLLKDEGYEVFVVFISNIPKKVVQKRALERYKKSGRFVPMSVIDDFYKNGDETFDKVKTKVDGYIVVDGSTFDYNVIDTGGKSLPNKRIYEKLGHKLKLEHGGMLKAYKVIYKGNIHIVNATSEDDATNEAKEMILRYYGDVPETDYVVYEVGTVNEASDEDENDFMGLDTMASGGSVNSDIKYRILTKDRKIKFAGTDNPSWFTLQKAKQVVNYSNGEMIYEYDLETMQPKWEILANGGGIDNDFNNDENMKINKKIDLFEDYENIPENVQNILDEYSEDFEDGNYAGLQKAQKELEAIGYTFDFYVDGSAYGLRPLGTNLNELEGYEDEEEVDVSKMQKIDVKGFEKYMPGIRYLYYDKDSDKYYFKGGEGDYFLVENTYTLNELKQFLNSKMARGGKILTADEEEQFQEWLQDGNVSKFEDGYATQDAGYGNRLKNMDELKKYFKKEFLSYAKGGGLKEHFPEVVLEIYANNSFYKDENFTENALIDVKDKKIKFTQLDTGSGNFRIAWKKVYENSNGYYIDYDYFGGRIYIENWEELCQDNKPNKMAQGGLMYAKGGEIGRDITFEDWKGDKKHGTILEIDENGNYIVASGFGRVLVTKDEVVKMVYGGEVLKHFKPSDFYKLGGSIEEMTPVEAFFSQLDYSTLPDKFSDYVKTQILTDPQLEIISENDPIFIEIKNKVNSFISSKEVVSDENMETQEAIDLLNELAQDQEGAEKEETLEAIELLKELLV